MRIDVLAVAVPGGYARFLWRSTPANAPASRPGGRLHRGAGMTAAGVVRAVASTVDVG